MDNCLHDLYSRCLISYDTAVSRARSQERFRPKGSRPPQGRAGVTTW